MTISKKLALFLTCALGMQFVSHAYDAVGLKTEVAQILDFIKELDKHHAGATCTIAGWLETNIAAEYNSVLNNFDIITIAQTCTANITMDAKLTAISQIMVAKAEQAQQSVQQELEWAKENAKQQAKWANDNAKNAENAMKAEAKREKKEIKKWEKSVIQWRYDDLYRGMIWGGLVVASGAISGVIVYNKLDAALMVRIAEIIAEKVADEIEKQHNKKTGKR